jgi:hypothetical protein
MKRCYFIKYIGIALLCLFVFQVGFFFGMVFDIEAHYASPPFIRKLARDLSAASKPYLWIRESYYKDGTYYNHVSLRFKWEESWYENNMHK